MRVKWKDVLFVLIVIIVVAVFGIVMYNIFTTDSDKNVDISGIPTVIPTATPKPDFDEPSGNTGNSGNAGTTGNKPTVAPFPTGSSNGSSSGGEGEGDSSDTSGITGGVTESGVIGETGEEGIDFTVVEPVKDTDKGFKIIHDNVYSAFDNGQGYELYIDGSNARIILSEADNEGIAKWREKALKVLGLYDYFLYSEQPIGFGSSYIKGVGIASPSLYFADGYDYTVGVSNQLINDGIIETKDYKAVVLTVINEWEHNKPISYCYASCYGTSFGFTLYELESVKEIKDTIETLLTKCIAGR